MRMFCVTLTPASTLTETEIGIQAQQSFVTNVISYNSTRNGTALENHLYCKALSWDIVTGYYMYIFSVQSISTVHFI